MLFTACVTGEFLTPMYPQHFLLLAAISNVGRAVGLTTFVSTQPAFQQALCASGNMADLASKTQVHTTVRPLEAWHTPCKSLLSHQPYISGSMDGHSSIWLRHLDVCSLAKVLYDSRQLHRLSCRSHLLMTMPGLCPLPSEHTYVCLVSFPCLHSMSSCRLMAAND
jgi:hypothetical protein